MTEEKKKVGFAAMSPERRREMASKGGKTAHAKGTRYSWTKEQAAAAGKLPHERGTAHKFTREELMRGAEASVAQMAANGGIQRRKGAATVDVQPEPAMEHDQ